MVRCRSGPLGRPPFNGFVAILSWHSWISHGSQAEEVASGNCSSMPYNVGTVRTGILRRLEDHLQAVFGADTV